MTVRLLSASERRAVPWKNGGGVTREIAVSPEGAGFDAFDWRLSMAEVGTAGPFSRFEGVDRVLTVLEGELQLSFPGGPEVVLTPSSEPFAFAGDRDCSGAPRSGPVTDLNVMVRRGRMRAEVRRVEASQTLIARGEALFVLALEAGTIGDFALEKYDVLIADKGESLVAEGAVRLLTVELFRL